MSEQVRQANRELRWEQIQAAIAELQRDGTTPITMVEVARRCGIPRTAISKEPLWKSAIADAEAARVQQRAERLHQMQVDFTLPNAPAILPPPSAERRRVSVETVVRDLRALMAQTEQEMHDAFERGREQGIAERPEPESDPMLEQAIFERGRQAARAEWDHLKGEIYEEGRSAGRLETQAELGIAYERGRDDGRKEALADRQQTQDRSREEIQQILERGRAEGRREFQEDLNQAYARGLADGRAEVREAAPRPASAAEIQDAFDRGRQMGRAELQVELKKAYDDGLKAGKQESQADVMNAYDRGRHDGWEEGRRETAGPGRSMFGFAVNRPNPDRDWALGLMHANAQTTPDQLRVTYRQLTKAYHPDRNPDVSPEFIRNLNRAKEILGF